MFYRILMIKIIILCCWLDENIHLQCNTSIYPYEENKRPYPVLSDFIYKYKVYKTKDRSQSPIALAVAMQDKDNRENYILDGTGGFGVDAFFLAYLGFNIVVLERDPVIYTLLKDGYHRGMQYKKLENILNRMKIINISVEDFLEKKQYEKKPNVIYLDPSYIGIKTERRPHKSESRIIRLLAGPSPNIDNLVQFCRGHALEKVVLKDYSKEITEGHGLTNTYKSRFERYRVFQPV